MVGKILFLIAFVFAYLQGTTPTIRCESGTAYTNLIFDNDSIVRANIYLSNDGNQVKLKWVLDKTDFGDSVYFTPTNSLPSNDDIYRVMMWELNYFDSVNNYKIRFQ